MNSKSKSSFRNPHGYFEAVQDEWKIKNLRLKKQGGFEIPQDYFKNKNWVNTQKTPKRKLNYLLYSSAASIIFILTLFLENQQDAFLPNNETLEETILLAEEAWENDIQYSLEPVEYFYDSELALENTMDYFVEDDRFVNLMYEDYE